ncbi:MAG: S8 family peptidase [Sphingomonas bacterium]
MRDRKIVEKRLGALCGGAALLVSMLTCISSAHASEDPGLSRPPPSVLGAAELPSVDMDAIPDEYLITFGWDADSKSQGIDLLLSAHQIDVATTEATWLKSVLKRLGAEIAIEYRQVLVGFSAHLPPAALAFARRVELESHGFVQVNENRVVRMFSGSTSTPTGIDRVDQRLLPLGQTFNARQTGEGVQVYIVDSGIHPSEEFSGRLGDGVNEVGDRFGTDDCEGHGTHVAGIIGSRSYGIASKVTLHPIRVFACATHTSTNKVIAGIEWLTAYHLAKHPGESAVVNMSLGRATYPKLNEAVRKSVAKGITYVVAAGNDDGADACHVSPAGEATAITVGSVDPETDKRAATSNIGKCLDLFAPGENILSVGIGNDQNPVTLSGTSMAAPHVAGVAALFLQGQRGAAPAEVLAAILKAADDETTSGWCGIDHRGKDSPDVLLHWGSGSGDGIVDAIPIPAPAICGKPATSLRARDKARVPLARSSARPFSPSRF